MAKKNDEQALKWMREVCLALPDTSEGVHYGEIVFSVGKEMFASGGEKRGPRRIAFKIDARRTADLLARDQRFKRHPYEKTGLWIKASDVDDWQQMRSFVEESYRLASQVQPAKRMNATKSRKTGRRE
jgi:predicted DNA-binding protein (MmcQ/YjbR family)